MYVGGRGGSTPLLFKIHELTGFGAFLSFDKMW